MNKNNSVTVSSQAVPSYKNFSVGSIVCLTGFTAQ